MSGVTIVGAGLAGLSAALTLAEAGVSCQLVSSRPSERSQSVMAEGGINAVLDVMGEHDDVREHFEETMRGGVWLADANAVWGLVNDAPGIVRRLEAMGVPFQREHGSMIQRNFGGQRKKRTAYAKSSTGKVLVSALVDAVRAYEATGVVKRMPHADLCDLIEQDGMCRGVVVRDVFTGMYRTLGGPVLLATGGMGALLGDLTTGTVTNMGDAAALALLHGVELANLEFLQYHPTTVPIADKHMLISEAARGEGGRLFTLREGRPWYFMEEKYPELGNLMPRDVVSREEYAVMHDTACDGSVYLDLTGLSSHVWKARLSDLRDEIRHYLDIDPVKTPVPVMPGLHYCMGGIMVDESHASSMPGLYAAGECACQYHGANRLGGNSLLGAIRGGMTAARSMLSVVQEQGAILDGDGVPQGWTPPCLAPDVASEGIMRRELQECMGITRDAEQLEAGLLGLEALPDSARVHLAQAVVQSALARKESRGAHQRSDYPQTSDEYRRTTIAREVDGRLDVSFQELPAVREGVPRL